MTRGQMLAWQEIWNELASQTEKSSTLFLLHNQRITFVNKMCSERFQSTLHWNLVFREETTKGLHHLIKCKHWTLSVKLIKNHHLSVILHHLTQFNHCWCKLKRLKNQHWFFMDNWEQKSFYENDSVYLNIKQTKQTARESILTKPSC